MIRYWKTAAAVVLLVLASGVLLGADETALPKAEAFTARLGWTPEDALDELAAPESLFPYRGELEEEDNVVFYYPDHSYLFWFRDRVWQLRLDRRWSGDIDGVSMGMTLDEVIAAWERPPINSRDEAPTWTLPDRGYPVRIRLYFGADGRLNDLYIYRSDW